MYYDGNVGGYTGVSALEIQTWACQNQWVIQIVRFGISEVSRRVTPPILQLKAHAFLQWRSGGIRVRLSFRLDRDSCGVFHHG